MYGETQFKLPRPYARLIYIHYIKLYVKQKLVSKSKQFENTTYN